MNRARHKTVDVFYPECYAAAVWEREGVVFSLVQHPTHNHYCGYCRFEGRPVKEQGYMGLLTYVPVHGGITYAEEDIHNGSMVYGFDCAHAGDDNNPDTRNLRWLKRQAEGMAWSIRLAKPYERRYMRCTTDKGKCNAIDDFHAELREQLGLRFNLLNNFGAMINAICGKP